MEYLMDSLSPLWVAVDLFELVESIIFDDVILCSAQDDALGMVNTSARTSPWELTMKQSCLSFETSIPTETTIAKTSSG